MWPAEVSGTSAMATAMATGSARVMAVR
jgi:hypothetical protein